MKLKIQARAKINWTLDVVGTLPNGYHDLDMLMQSVTLCDQMTMEEAPQLTLYVRAQGRSFVPADGNNLVLKAAAALQAATGCTRGARITLKKYIPVAAGMGGGSSDAAAALVGLNRLWGLGLSPDKLEEIGLTVGADVPFCIRGGLQRAKGVGEKLTPLAMKKRRSTTMTISAANGCALDARFGYAALMTSFRKSWALFGMGRAKRRRRIFSRRRFVRPAADRWSN